MLHLNLVCLYLITFTSHILTKVTISLSFTSSSSWIFRHPNILTHPPDEDGLSPDDGNECGWLWRSYKTDDYNLLSTSEGAWSAWIGEVKPLVQVSITSLECWERSDCNYNGMCINNVCVCDETHLGGACEFELPCPSLVSEKAHDIYGKHKYGCITVQVFVCYHLTRMCLSYSSLIRFGCWYAVGTREPNH